MTRQEKIEKILEWDYEIKKIPSQYDYFQDREREIRLRNNKINELNSMTDSELETEFLEQLIIRTNRKVN